MRSELKLSPSGSRFARFDYAPVCERPVEGCNLSLLGDLEEGGKRLGHPWNGLDHPRMGYSLSAKASPCSWQAEET